VKVILFGATGRVGKLVLEEVKRHGYEVVCFTGDVRIHQDVEKFFSKHDNVDAVISTLGSWGAKTQDILSSGMSYIIPAMKQHKIRRIISLTGAETRSGGDKPTWSSRVLEIILKIIAPEVYKDGQKHLEMLQSSGLNWTVIRSSKMSDTSSSTYMLNAQCPHAWQQVSRQAVACAVVDSLKDRHFQRAPFIHS
jgi:putative NADH-flavin reductase